MTRKEMIEFYGTPKGQKMLFALLADHGLFRDIRPEELELRREGLRIADAIGLLNPKYLKEMLRYFFTLDLSEHIRLDEEEKKLTEEYRGL